MNIFLSPHNDDEALFGSIIIQRMKPLLLVIVTDSFIQERRGDGITWQQRRLESSEAAKILGVPICFLGIPDADLTDENFLEALRLFHPSDSVIGPAKQGGNPQHDIVADVANKYFRRLHQYATYARGEHFSPIAGRILEPTDKENAVKSQVLQCYRSQIELASTRPHFERVLNQPEYLRMTSLYSTGGLCSRN